MDATSEEALEKPVAAHDIVIALVPHPCQSPVIKAAIKGKTHVVNTCYLFPDMKELYEEAKKAGIVVLCEIGVDPGLDHLYAVKTISEVHAKGGKVRLLAPVDDGFNDQIRTDQKVLVILRWSACARMLRESSRIQVFFRPFSCSAWSFVVGVLFDGRKASSYSRE